MLIYIKDFFLSKNFYLILFSFWLFKQVLYFYETLSIYKNLSLIFIVIFLLLLILVYLSIFNILNKKEFFQYFSILFFLLVISNFVYDLAKDTIKQKRQEIYIKKLLKEKNKYESFDFRNQKQVVEDLKKESKENVYQAILPSFYFKEPKFFSSILPLSGISHSTTVLCNESGKFSIYKSDRYGFNNPDINYDILNDKIMLIGDSFIHGACVDPEDTLSSELNKIGISALSISFGGNGPLFQLASLIEYIDFIKPKTVIWFYAENDLPNLIIEKESNFLMQYLLKKDFSQNLALRQSEIDDLWIQILNKNLDVVDYIEITKKKTFFRNFFRKLERSLLLKPMRDFLKFYYEKELIKHYENTNKENITLYRQILLKVKDLSIENNSSLTFVYLPFLSSITNEISSKKEIIETVSNLNIKVLDFHEHLSKKDDPSSFFPFGKGGHYNEKGYKELSNFILENLNL